MSQLVIKDTQAQKPHPSQPSISNDELPEAYVKARAKFKRKHKLPQQPEEINMEASSNVEPNWEEIAPAIRQEVVELEDTQFVYLYLRAVVNRSRAKSQEATVKNTAKYMLQAVIGRLETEIAQRKNILASMPQS